MGRRWEGDGRAMPSYSPLALLLSHRLPTITMPQTLVTIGCITIAIARHTRAPRCPLPIALARCCTSAPTSVVWAELIRATHLCAVLLPRSSKQVKPEYNRTTERTFGQKLRPLLPYLCLQTLPKNSQIKSSFGVKKRPRQIGYVWTSGCNKPRSLLRLRSSTHSLRLHQRRAGRAIRASKQPLQAELLGSFPKTSPAPKK